MSTIGDPSNSLELANVIKVSEAVSGEIELGRLIDTLMRTALEHAGAERGLLILPRETDYQVEAEATVRVTALRCCRDRQMFRGQTCPITLPIRHSKKETV